MRLSWLLGLSMILLLAAALSPGPALADAVDSEKSEPTAGAGEADKAGKPGAKKSPQIPTRMLQGSVTSVDATGLSVELASGKRVRYEKTATTLVRGQKKAWEDLASGDEVKLRLRGRKLHAVVVSTDAEGLAEIERKRREAIDGYRAAEKARKSKAKAKKQAK